MDKIKKIGFLEKWNKEAGTIEKSAKNIKTGISLLASIGYAFTYLFAETQTDWYTFSIVFLALLIYSYNPQSVGELTDKIKK